MVFLFISAALSSGANLWLQTAHNVRTKSSLMAATFLGCYQNAIHLKTVELAYQANKKEDLKSAQHLWLHRTKATVSNFKVVHLHAAAWKTLALLLPQHNARFYTFFCTVATSSESLTELRSEFINFSFPAPNSIRYKTTPSLTINTILPILRY